MVIECVREILQMMLWFLLRAQEQVGMSFTEKRKVKAADL